MRRTVHYYIGALVSVSHRKRVSAMLKSMHRIGSRLVSVMLSLALVLAPLAQVQAQFDDTEAPVLIHRQLDSGVAGELQTFLARVSDDFGVSEVTLYYRQSDTGEFNSLNMRPLLDSIGEYMIAIETSISGYAGFQYYIEAVDEAGNRTNRGFEYAPIILPLSPPAPSVTANTTPGPIAQPGTQAAETVPGPQSDGLSIKPTTILLGLGALLAVGALVAGGSGGGGDDTPDTPDVNPDPSTVTITVISDLPTAE